MKSKFSTEGYEIHRSVLPADTIEALRSEVDRISKANGKTCLRNLRMESAMFDQLSTSPEFLALLPDSELRPVRSILFDKTPERNWPVLWHQDLTIAVKRQIEVGDYGPWSIKENHPHVQPPVKLLSRMATLRLHLDDTPYTNGALSVIPQSHQNGKISTESITANLKQQAIHCECESGDILLMSPLLLHSSARSKTPSRRRVIHIEYARRHDLPSELEWLED